MEGGVYGYFMVSGLFLVSVLEYGIIKAFSVIVNDMKVDLDISMSFFGMIMGMSHGLSLSLSLINVPLLRRYSHRQLIMLGGIMASVSYSAVSLTTSKLQLALCMVGVGLGNILILLPVHTSIATYFPNTYEIVNGVANAGGGVGIMVVPVVADFLNRVYGWRGSTMILGGIAFNMALGGALLRPITHSMSPGIGETQYCEEPVEEVDPLIVGQQEESFSRVADSAQHHGDNVFAKFVRFFDLDIIYDYPLIRGGIFIVLIYFMVNNAWLAFVIPNAVAKGIPPHLAISIAVVSGISNTIGRLVIGFISSMKLVRDDFILCLLNAVSGIAFIFNNVATELWSLCILASLNGVTVGALSTLITIYNRSLIPPERFKAAVGLLHLLPGFFEIGGDAGVGYLYDVTSSFDLSYTIVGILNLMPILIIIIPIMVAKYQHQ